MEQPELDKSRTRKQIDGIPGPSKPSQVFSSILQMEVMQSIPMYKFRLGNRKIVANFRTDQQFNLETTIVAPSQMNIPVHTPQTFILWAQAPTPFSFQRLQTRFAGLRGQQEKVIKTFADDDIVGRK